MLTILLSHLRDLKQAAPVVSDSLSTVLGEGEHAHVSDNLRSLLDAIRREAYDHFGHNSLSKQHENVMMSNGYLVRWRSGYIVTPCGCVRYKD